MAVVSIGGKYRGGKSFLLNFFLRYLSYLESIAAGERAAVDDWMEPTSEDDEEDRQLFEWKGGNKRITKGVHMWHRPFMLKRSDGTKFAVLLVDTQGTDDSGSSDNESIAIFALSTMLSSCMVTQQEIGRETYHAQIKIYNVKQTLDKTAIQQMQRFTEYGRKAMDGQRGSRKHFQVVR